VTAARELTAARAPRATIAHLPALDGLRGLAVVAVLLFHDDRLVGGYLGVDLFFVLSGYLITSLLLAEWRGAGRVDLAAFWIRRARRLFPALVALLFVVAAYARLVARPEELARIRGDGLATLAYVANWRAIFSGKSYWDLFVAPSPLEHTWSLAIEEQFYVLWPLLFVAVLGAAKGSARALLAVTAALGLASAAAMAWLYTPETSSRVYMGTDTRGAAILAGAALACSMSLRGPLARAGAIRALDAAGLVALVGLGVAWARLDGQSAWLYHGGFWATELAALVLIACAAHGSRSVVARGLGALPLVKLGQWSYGIYLYHWPFDCVLTAGRLGFGGVRLSLLRLAATFAVALASFFVLEQPIRKRGLPFGRPVAVVPAAAAAVVLALVLGTRARPVRAAAPPPEVEGSTRVLVLGDSVAVALGERLRFVQRGTDASVVVRAAGDCSLLEGVVPVLSLNGRAHDGGDCAAAWASDATELRPAVTLVVLGGGFFARAHRRRASSRVRPELAAGLRQGARAPARVDPLRHVSARGRPRAVSGRPLGGREPARARRLLRRHGARGRRVRTRRGAARPARRALPRRRVRARGERRADPPRRRALRRPGRRADRAPGAREAARARVRRPAARLAVRAGGLGAPGSLTSSVRASAQRAGARRGQRLRPGRRGRRRTSCRSPDRARRGRRACRARASSPSRRRASRAAPASRPAGAAT
jgi:peptidoglycan/LPS O-acetylase OafA/YrhL